MELVVIHVPQEVIPKQIVCFKEWDKIVWFIVGCERTPHRFNHCFFHLLSREVAEVESQKDLVDDVEVLGAHPQRVEVSLKDLIYLLNAINVQTGHEV